MDIRNVAEVFATTRQFKHRLAVLAERCRELNSDTYLSKGTDAGLEDLGAARQAGIVDVCSQLGELVLASLEDLDPPELGFLREDTPGPDLVSASGAFGDWVSIPGFPASTMVLSAVAIQHGTKPPLQRSQGEAMTPNPVRGPETEFLASLSTRHGDPNSQTPFEYCVDFVRRLMCRPCFQKAMPGHELPDYCADDPEILLLVIALLGQWIAAWLDRYEAALPLNFQPWRWFKQHTTVSEHQLRKAKQRGQIDYRINGTQVLYSVPDSEHRWPAQMRRHKDDA